MITNQQKKEIDCKIDKMVDEWFYLDEAKDKGRKLALFQQIMLLVWNTYDRQMNYEKNDVGLNNANDFWDIFSKTIKKYNPEKVKNSSFTHYFSATVRFQININYKGKNEMTVSLDKPLSDDTEDTLLDTIAGSEDIQDESSERINALMSDLTAMILNFAKLHKGHSNNEKRQSWYQIFFTEDITYSLKETSMEIKFRHERDVFKAMNLEYLDYYMSHVCRTKEEIRKTPLKKYNEIVPAAIDEMGETPLPLPADVSIAYYQCCKGTTVTRSNRSNHMARYKEEKGQLLNDQSI